MRFDILVSIQKNIMSILVVSKLLLLLSYVDSDLNGLFHVSNSSV